MTTILISSCDSGVLEIAHLHFWQDFCTLLQWDCVISFGLQKIQDQPRQIQKSLWTFFVGRGAFFGYKRPIIILPLFLETSSVCDEIPWCT
jgi:hypothetical protein